MTQKLIYYDGLKHADLLSDDPTIWNTIGVVNTDDIILYSRVAAAFRAYNLKANAVAGMPFSLNKLKSGEEFDNSKTWENKVKFLPNPSELFRLNTLSYIATNTIYCLRTKDALGYKTKGLYHASPYLFRPITNAQLTDIDYIERQEGTTPVRYQYPEDPRLVRMWRFDHTTELLPSPNTEAQAILNSAGVIYHADRWIKHFFERGGIAPTVIAMKGAVTPQKRDDEEKSWTEWLLGLGRRFGSRIARVFNADTLDVKQFGSSVTELKDSPVYKQALENIAMGHGIPLSLLLSNSANYATAEVERATWYDNEIIPFCNWLAFEYNEQVFHPIGLHLQFHPETLDPQQEDETQRAMAFNTYGDSFSKYPTYGLWRGAADTIGIEVSDTWDAAAQAYYQEKNKPKETPPRAAPNDNQDVMAKSVKANDYSSMIALRIPEPIRAEIKAHYDFVDEETLNDLHITLVYLGDSRTIDKSAVLRAVSDFGLFQFPIKGRIQGLARFVNGGEKDPLVCTFDSPQMPEVYSTLTGMLDNYRVAYHKEHGFIPHMTLAYIPKDAEMPIETIEPIEVNFSQVYYVDGNVWYPVNLTGYENKTVWQTERLAESLPITQTYIDDACTEKAWTPSLDELEELRVYREIALRRHKKGESLDFEYKPHRGGLPENVTEEIKTALMKATTVEDVKAAFDMRPVNKQRDDNFAILELAKSLNKLADVEKKG